MSPRRRRLSASRTTSHRTGWAFDPEGPLVAASTIFKMSASLTSLSGSRRRMARVVAMASKTSTAAESDTATLNFEDLLGSVPKKSAKFGLGAPERHRAAGRPQAHAPVAAVAQHALQPAPVGGDFG